MSQTTVYNAAKIPQSKRKDIEAALLAALLAAYAATIRLQLRQHGYGDRLITITDPEVVARLKARAKEHSLTVVLFTNQLLKRFIDKLDQGLTDEQIVTALQPFWDQAAAYNQTTLSPFVTRWARAQAISDFTEKNLADQDVLWECVPNFTNSTDQDCDCPAAIDASPMTFDEAESFSMPNHPNCFHSMEPIITTVHVFPDDPWTGEAAAVEEAA